MKAFNLSIPTRVHFGLGQLDRAIEEEKRIFPPKVMLVTGKHTMRKLGYTDRVRVLLESIAGVKEVVLFEEISPNPKAMEINSAISLGLKKGVELVIGLGGGSSIDSAKSIAVGIGGKSLIEPFLFEGRALPTSTLPIVAIPTTAGTGSELSKGAIVTSSEKGIKTGLRGEGLYPVVAIVDPELTFHLPVKVTVETGFDVFAHAVETYIAKPANDFSEMLSLDAIESVVKYLPRVAANGQDTEAREKMSYASMMMGINLANIGTCLPHRLQYPVGAMTDTGHALGLACIYRAWFHSTYEFSRDKFDTIGSLLSCQAISGADEVEAALSAFLEKLGLTVSLSMLGIEKKNILALCDGVTGNLANDPAGGKPGIVREILEHSL